MPNQDNSDQVRSSTTLHKTGQNSDSSSAGNSQGATFTDSSLHDANQSVSQNTDSSDSLPTSVPSSITTTTPTSTTTPATTPAPSSTPTSTPTSPPTSASLSSVVSPSLSALSSPPITTQKTQQTQKPQHTQVPTTTQKPQQPQESQQSPKTEDAFSSIAQEETADLRQRIEQANIPHDLLHKLEREIRLLERSAQTNNYGEAYERTVKYVDWCLRVPWNEVSEDNLDLERAKKIFEKHHYGMQSVKDRILEYLAILKLQQQKKQQGQLPPGVSIHAPQLLLVGLVGTGKTTFAYAIAEALGREIVRIPFGGMSSARDLRGESRLHLNAEPGLLIKGLANVKTRNPVILLDEIDRVAEAARMDIMGVLVELLDPKQNDAFTDHFLDYPVNLSEAFFIATANNTRAVATAVMDRLERIDMPSYSDEEKIVIAKHYIMPRLLQESGMDPQSLVIADDVWPSMVRPLGFDAGLRTLERNLKGAVAKSARLQLEKGLQQVVINQDNVKFFLPSY